MWKQKDQWALNFPISNAAWSESLKTKVCSAKSELHIHLQFFFGVNDIRVAQNNTQNRKALCTIGGTSRATNRIPVKLLNHNISNSVPNIVYSNVTVQRVFYIVSAVTVPKQSVA